MAKLYMNDTKFTKRVKWAARREDLTDFGDYPGSHRPAQRSPKLGSVRATLTPDDDAPGWILLTQNASRMSSIRSGWQWKEVAARPEWRIT